MIKQQGFSLIMVMMVLVVLLVIGFSFMRSTSIANVVADNIAFKEASKAAAIIGGYQALTELANRTNPEVDVAGQYFATQQTVDSNGLPQIDWRQVPITKVQSYNVQHITERLCLGALPIQNPAAQCAVGQLAGLNSNKVGAPIYGAGNSYFYRVTIQVTGPKSTLTFIQTILKK